MVGYSRSVPVQARIATYVFLCVDRCIYKKNPSQLGDGFKFLFDLLIARRR